MGSPSLHAFTRNFVAGVLLICCGLPLQGQVAPPATREAQGLAVPQARQVRCTPKRTAEARHKLLCLKMFQPKGLITDA